MLITSPTLGLGVKIIGLTVIAAMLLSASLSMGIQSSYAQFGAQTQEQESQDTGEQQVESDGGLTATLNGDSFRRGDTIIISGTVAEREGGSTVYARIYDPDSIELDIEGIHVNTDGTFRHGFVAGEDSLNDGTSDPMTESGTYTITLEYFPPTGGTETTELTFEYDAEAAPAVGEEDDSATMAAEGPTTTYQNLTEGYRVQVPNGWIADYLGDLCPTDQALPRIGGLYECTFESAADDMVIIFYKIPNLSTRPEFAPLVSQNQNITINDLLASDIDEARRLYGPELAAALRIESQTDVAINVIDPVTNQTVQTVPAKEAVYSFAFPDEPTRRIYSLVVLSDNGNTGYTVHPLGRPIREAEEMPVFVRQVFDSFELLANSSQVQQPTTAEAQLSQQNNATAAMTAPFSSNITASTAFNLPALPPPQQQEPPSSPLLQQSQSQQQPEL